MKTNKNAIKEEAGGFSMINRPDYIESAHWNEWLASAVAPEIIVLNLVSLLNNLPYDYLLYSDRISRRNDGRLREYLLQKYRHIEHGGWWCSGVDPLDNCNPMLWGCFKPDIPRRDSQKIEKFIKYEHPYRVPTRAFFLRVTWNIGLTIATTANQQAQYEQRILQAYRQTQVNGEGSRGALVQGSRGAGEQGSRGEFNVPCSFPSAPQPLRTSAPPHLSPSAPLPLRTSASSGTGFGTSQHPNQNQESHKNSHLSPLKEVALLSIAHLEDGQFWQWVLDNNIPLIICEGAKKAASLLSAGYAAIAIPGVNGGYRNPESESLHPLNQPFLIPDLQKFATPNRKIDICFDHDSKPETLKRVSAALTGIARLFSLAQCSVGVVELPGPSKGVDDFIMAGGNFDKLYQTAPTFEQWQVLQYTKLTYTPSVVLNQPYLGQLTIPDGAKIVGLKSPKGTGKTTSFDPIVRKAIANGQPVLLIGHRVQLVQEIADRIGIPYITEVRESETGMLLGYGLCVDSLHPNSQAHFNADNWKNAIVIIDECEQVIWHTLTANTEINLHRVEVIQQLTQLLHNTINSERGMLILSDADLSNLTIEFIQGAAGVDIEPWLLVNTWKPEIGWKVHHYNQTTPILWFAALEEHIKRGGRPFIVTQSQKAKSTWGTINLEARLRSEFPCLRILRIDSETIQDPTHSAYGCISKLNQILKDFDIVIVSPSIETGVSIDIREHFTSVWGCFCGVSPENSARQSLARVREEVDRYLWVASRGLGQIGNGAISLKSLLCSEHKKFKVNMRHLQDAGLTMDGDDIHVNKTALHTWGKMACRVNAGMIDYRGAVLAGLVAEGHHIIDGVNNSDIDPKDLLNSIKELKSANYRTECEEIAAIDMDVLTRQKLEALKLQKSKTPDERRIERKYTLEQLYHLTVTPELVQKDDHGWYPQLRLHYFLSLGRSHLSRRDAETATAITHQQKLWMPDFNKGQLGATVAALELLGIPEFLESGRQLRGNDDDLQRLKSITQANRWDMKSIFGISIPVTNKPIVILRRILNTLGLGLKQIARDGTGARQRVYQVVGLDDGRDEVFAAWLSLHDTNSLRDFQLKKYPIAG
ncbi:plasmid replication protein, CyRepA1 family [Nostoc sphaeroides]